MQRYLPFSLLFFVTAGGVFLLQTIPAIGVFLMIMSASAWPALLVNAGMIGIVVEVLTRRTAHLWLLLPIAFYGTYWTVALREQITLHRHGATYDAHNASISLPFDPASRALVLDGVGDVSKYILLYDVPVAYEVSRTRPEGYVSHHLTEQSLCEEFRKSQVARAGSVWAFGIHDDDDHFITDFCDLTIPEAPTLPIVRAVRTDERIVDGGLAITRITTTVTDPDGHSVRLLGGYAAPLTWIPLPMAGCGLNSAGPSWDCGAWFQRRASTPLVSGTGRSARDRRVLARALGLRPVARTERRGTGRAILTPKIAQIETNTLADQLAHIDAMIADPFDRAAYHWQTEAVVARLDTLEARAAGLVGAVERAVGAAESGDRVRGRDSGRVLAGLIALLPAERLRTFAPRLIALCSLPRQKTWFWEALPLIRRLGDLGPAATACLADPRGSDRRIDDARTEGLCRIGPPARGAAEPELHAMWNASRDRDVRAALFVAMRRIGTALPPADGGDDLARLAAEWSDISPASPPSVCATGREREVRRIARARGERPPPHP